MHPDFLQQDIHQNQRALEARLRFAHLGRDEPTPPSEDVVLRLCSVRDDDVLALLAALEGRPAPKGRCVVAEVDGTVVAALPLLGGAPLADPFRATSHLLPLLSIRARQIAPPVARVQGFRLRGVVRGLGLVRR